MALQAEYGPEATDLDALKAKLTYSYAQYAALSLSSVGQATQVAIAVKLRSKAKNGTVGLKQIRKALQKQNF